MSNKKDKMHTRAPGMTQISISLPKRLVDKVDGLAKNDKRSRSNYITLLLENLPEIESAEANSAYLQAAEPKVEFNS